MLNSGADESLADVVLLVKPSPSGTLIIRDVCVSVVASEIFQISGTTSESCLNFQGLELRGKGLPEILQFAEILNDSQTLTELLSDEEEHYCIFQHPKRAATFDARVNAHWGSKSVTLFVRLASKKLLSLMDEVSSIDIRAAVTRSPSTSAQENIQGLMNYASALLSIFNSMNFSVLLENEERKLMMVNKSFCSLFQIPVDPSMLVGSDCVENLKRAKPMFMNPDAILQRVEEIISKKETVTNEEILFSSNTKIQLTL